MTEYYVVRDKNTGLYFRGKGVNRWGKYYNQASIYRIRANAENTIKEVSWRGEQAEVVPIQIIEDVVPRSEVEKAKQEVSREIFKEMAMVATQIMIDEIRIQVAKHTTGHLPLFPNTEEEFIKYIEQFIEVFKKFEF